MKRKKFKKKIEIFVFCFASFFENEHIVISIIESCLDVVKVNPPRKPSRDPRRLASNSRSAVSPGTRSFMYIFFFLTTHGLGFFCVPLNHFQKKMNPLRLFSTMVGMMMMMIDPLTRKYPSLSLSFLFFLTTSIERTDTSRLANSPLALVPAPRSTWPRFWNT